VLALQRTPGALHSVEDVEVTGPAGPLSVRVYRPGPGRLHPVLFLHGGWMRTHALSGHHHS
jgi:acetyl esterase/lipase